ncbi:MAG: hypothetical protein CM1200mP39_25060 [Dehalococcoidia bacterium]|nr:MAG: hypothetical protein CM1200mP39_25060 [Dehalococcoidia bacterium]
MRLFQAVCLRQDVGSQPTSVVQSHPNSKSTRGQHHAACWESGKIFQRHFGVDEVTVENGQQVLSVRNLKKYFDVRSGVLARKTGNVYAVDGVSFDLAAGETLGLLVRVVLENRLSVV